MTSIAQKRKEVEHAVQAAFDAVEKDGHRTAQAAEQAVWACLLALGRALMAWFFSLRAARHEAEAGTYQHEGLTYRLAGRQESEIGTRFGRVRFERAVGRVVGLPRWSRDLPLDRELGLMSGFTAPVVTTMSRMCAQMAFAQARETFRSIVGWTPSQRDVLRMVDSMGQRARPFLEQAPPPEDDGEVLVITIDGKGAPKMAAVGVLYTLRRDADGKLDGPLNKRVYATFESYRALFLWVHEEAKKRGYGTGKFKQVLFIADGAEVLWSLQQELFPDAEVCIDWYHVVEKLWAAGKAICRGTRRHRQALETWVAEQKRQLRNGQLDQVIATIRGALDSTPVTGPGNKYRREVLGKTLAHLEKNAARLRYALLREQDLPIGSGVVEGAVRHLVGIRLDGPGMRWGRDRAEAVLHLRCVLINRQWEDFENHVNRLPLRLAAQPVPTRTHDAVVKLAA